jgi:hypothetical protein
MQPFPKCMTRLALALLFSALLGPVPQVSAHLLDSPLEFATAVAKLRGVVGDKARVLQIEARETEIAIEVQDPADRRHVDRYTCDIDKSASSRECRVKGPSPVKLSLIDPDLEANLFDFDAVDFTGFAALAKAAIERARLEDPAHVAVMRIARGARILPEPAAGDIVWDLTVASDREAAEIHADARGRIIGASLGGTRRAQSLNLLKQTTLLVDAAHDFGTRVSADAIVTRISVSEKTVAFGTNERGGALAQLAPGLPTTRTYLWSIDGLSQTMGDVAVAELTGAEAPASFKVDDVDWARLADVETAALAHAAVPGGRIREVAIEKRANLVGNPILMTTVEIVDGAGAVTRVVVDASGVAISLDLPLGQTRKPDWLEADALPRAIEHVRASFGAEAKLVRLELRAAEARVTLEDPAKPGQVASFDFAGEGFERAVSFSLDARGKTFPVNVLAPIGAELIKKLEADAFKRLAGGHKSYLNSVSIGSYFWKPEAGPRLIVIELRDAEVDSASAHYASAVYDFSGRLVDLAPY